MALDTRRFTSSFPVLFDLVKVLFFLYCFMVSIDLMGLAFKSSGEGFTKLLSRATDNPFIGLIIGIVVTSIIQSSSTTTSVIVALVGAGTISITQAVPMIMGANIGTTVTCTIVSFGYVGRKTEFERSFGASIVHDTFNILTTMVMFPLELTTGLISRSAVFVVGGFQNIGGMNMVSPLGYILRPVSEFLAKIIGNHWLALVIALVLLFLSMALIVQCMQGMVMKKVEHVLNKYLFKNILVSLFFGLIFTSIIQSSSIATSLLVPLVAANVLTLEQVFPYTMGANLGTTVTALLAALSVGTVPALSIALCHTMFNLYGIMIFLPLRKIPIWIARSLAHFVAKSRRNFIFFLFFFISLHIVPIVLAFLD